MVNSLKKKKLLLLLSLLKIIQKRKCLSTRKRMYQVHPIYRARKSHGEYFNLMKSLQRYPVKFYEYFRMTKEQLNFILIKIDSDIKPRHNLFRNPQDYISSKEKLCLTLRFLATGASFADLSFRFLMGKATVRNCIIQTINAINRHLKSEFMPIPSSPSDWKDIADGFLECWNFPNCVGSLDGKPVRMFAPRNSGSFNFNYKKCFSTILMAVVDARYRFVVVSIGAHGSNSDSTVFSYSDFGKAWINNPEILMVPVDTPLPGTTDPQPYVLVGDEAFGLKYNLLTPYPVYGLSNKQRIFNYRQSRARRIVESTFGITTHTWRILLKPLEVQPEVAKPLILCCCILHNYLQARRKIVHPNRESVPIVDSSIRKLQPASNAITIRNKFADWMVAEGDVHFQYENII